MAMIKVYVIYPNSPGATFDMDYYLTKHMPMVVARLKPALKAMTVDHGIGGAQPGTEAAYRVITTLSFDSVETFQTAFTPHAAEIQGDISNFTNIAPTVQISEVKI
jgi:uncharacterized protein (TIGR02118 family)